MSYQTLDQRIEKVLFNLEKATRKLSKPLSLQRTVLTNMAVAANTNFIATINQTPLIPRMAPSIFRVYIVLSHIWNFQRHAK